MAAPLLGQGRERPSERRASLRLATMPPRLVLTARQARTLHLAAQGLAEPPRRRATRAAVRAAVVRMALLQLDTIQVVARSQHLVLFARLGDYRPAWLDELVASAALFETWAHEACVAPIEDYPLHRCLLETRDHWFVNRARRLLRRQGRGMLALLEQIRAGGPVRSADFEAPRRRGGPGWWGWKKEKAWLEAWLALGELMVARREGFQRVYDLTARVHPAAATAPRPTPEEARREVVARAVRALGVTQARWVHDYFRLRPRLDEAALAPLVADGTLLEVAVRGWPGPGYVHRDHRRLLARVAAGALTATHTALLSPFDPVVWDRERARELFGFDYRLECYTPAAQRRHGYFALPILRRGALVGRLDAKAWRGEGRFEVKALHLEAGVRPTRPLLLDLAGALTAAAAWHGTPAVALGPGVPAALSRVLRPLLRSAPGAPGAIGGTPASPATSAAG